MSSDKAPEKSLAERIKENEAPDRIYWKFGVHGITHWGKPAEGAIHYIREDLVQKAKRDAAEYVLSNGTDNFIRRREMFEKVYLSCLSNMANDQLSDAVFNNKVEAQTEELLKRADKFAWGEE